MKILLFTSLLILLFGCTPKYTINTEPSNAIVKVNGEYLGKSPVVGETHCRTFGRPEIEISKEGHTTHKSKLEFEPSVGNIILDILLFWPLVFLNADCPKDEYHFLLDPIVVQKGINAPILNN